MKLKRSLPALSTRMCFVHHQDVVCNSRVYTRVYMCWKSLQENVSRLEGVNIKLRKEKVDLVKEISSIKQEAHQDILRTQAALDQKVQGLESQAKELKEQLETSQKALREMTIELSAAQETMKQDAGTIVQVLNTLFLRRTIMHQGLLRTMQV